MMVQRKRAPPGAPLPNLIVPRPTLSRPGRGRQAIPPNPDDDSPLWCEHQRFCLRGLEVPVETVVRAADAAELYHRGEGYISVVVRVIEIVSLVAILIEMSGPDGLLAAPVVSAKRPFGHVMLSFDEGWST